MSGERVRRYQWLALLPAAGVEVSPECRPGYPIHLAIPRIAFEKASWPEANPMEQSIVPVLKMGFNASLLACIASIDLLDSFVPAKVGLVKSMHEILSSLGWRIDQRPLD
ncbi:hypothetical protein [Sulfuritalea sp.]|uniref:hypothetical protein n=1 Tax=Sulfuritalea sp. TaxID=2480090 RepID=UPI001AC95A57|nr:hypothetical protein [Sulfuritalea sp.]MBN8476595.1 hypothetical protein [Sulfuritalea sp.]